MGACVFAVVANTQAQVVPSALVSSVKVGKKDSDNPMTDQILADNLSQQLDETGRLSSLVYSMTDPHFRDILTKNPSLSVADNPTVSQVVELARKIGVRYVFAFSTEKSDKGLVARLNVYSYGRRVWQNSQKCAVRNAAGAFDASNTASSVARTWVMLGEQAFLKELPKRHKSETPKMGAGQEPPKVVEPTKPVVESFAQTQEYVQLLMKQGLYQRAGTSLRDAVDASPLDVERRKALISFLQQTGQLTDAADEARRAASVVTEDPSLHMLAARCWVLAGKPSEARADVNEVLARDPKSHEALLLSAEIALCELNPEQALDPLDQLIKIKPTADGFFDRAVARALMGGTDGLKKDLEQVNKIEPKPADSDVVRRYSLATQVIDRTTAKAGEEIRGFIQRVAVGRNKPGVRDSLDTYMRVAQARSALMDFVRFPASSSTSHEKRSLVQKLLIQSLANLDDYVGSGNQDSLADSRMNLGEALKELASVNLTDSNGVLGGQHAGDSKP